MQVLIQKMSRFFKILSLVLVAGTLNCVNAETADSSSKKLILKAQTDAVNMEMVIKDNFIKAKYASAENRFTQGNIKASYNDFADLILKISISPLSLTIK